jgi:hypothetical protein
VPKQAENVVGRRSRALDMVQPQQLMQGALRRFALLSTPSIQHRMAGTALLIHQGTACAASSTRATAVASSGSAECGTPSVLRSRTAGKTMSQCLKVEQ